VRGVAGKLAGLLLAVALTAAHHAVAASPVPEPVIIDTDVGDDIDDAFALAIALQDPRLQVIGITTALGDTWTRTLLVRRLLATLGRKDVVVAQGPKTLNNVPFTQKKWADAATDTSAPPDAIEFIRDQVNQRPGQISPSPLSPTSKPCKSRPRRRFTS
jgi:inosine-uridine nucleoside N-ribohydrolase